MRCVISAELLAQRLYDTSSGPLPALPPGSITALIKTFERPREVRRLVRSISRLQPDLPILVVDDSQNPVEIDGASVIRLPFNSGISAGRNAGLDRIDTPYFVLLDDDFYFTRHTGLAKVVAVLETSPDIDILGGEVINLPDYRVHAYDRAPLFPGAKEPRHPIGSRISNLPVLPKVPNFFVGRTDRIRMVRWSDELKVIEHRDFFTRASGVLSTVQDRDFRILHARNPFDRALPEREINAVEARRELERRYFGAG